MVETMKKIYLIMFAAFAIIVATSCTKELVSVDLEEGTVQKGKVAMVFNVAIDEDSRATLSDDLKVNFVNGDEIAVFDGISTDPNKFIVQNATGNSATISGTVSEGAQDFKAVYPFSAAVGIQEGVLTINIPSAQVIPAGKNIDPSALVSIATASAGTILLFKNAVSLLKFTLSTNDVNFVCIKSNSGEPLSGNCSIEDEDKTITGEAAVDVALEGGAAFSNSTYYAAVLPTNLPNGIGVFCKKASGYDCKVSDKATAIVANSGLNLGTVDGVAFPTEIKTKVEFMAFADFASLLPATCEVKLGNDIDMQGVKVNSVSHFEATLDGQDHSIDNLKITAPLFVENVGKIKNLKIGSTCQIVPNSAIFAPVVMNNLNLGELDKVVNNAAVKFESDVHVDGGALLAGLVVYNRGVVQNCENYGEVSYVVNATSDPWGVAGLVSTNGGKVDNCSNKGKIVSYADCCLTKKSIGELGFSATGCTGGIVAYSWEGGRVENSTNDGEIDYKVTSIHLPEASVNRNQIAGIVAAPNGDVVNCINNGNITAVLTKVLEAENKEYIVGVGGISGGDYFAANSQSNSNIIGCTNNGTLMLTSDHSGSNNTIGGIVAWPCAEATASNVVTKECINNGDIFVSGTLKCRAGGVQGGSGRLQGCVNNGNISFSSEVNTGSAAGSLCGFHSNGFEIVDCKALGSVKTEAVLVGLGGLVGAIGNAALTSGTGCMVNCELTSPEEQTEIGLLIGHFNGTSKAITLGTDTDKIKIAGKVNGTTITADNYLNYITSSSNYTPSKHKLNVEYGE